MSDATQHRVEVGGEGSLHNGGSVRVTNKDITRKRAVTFPFVGGCFERREEGLPDPRRACSGDGDDETALPDKSVVFSASLGSKGRRVERGDLEESRFAVRWEEVRMCVDGVGRTLGERDGNLLFHLHGLKGPGVHINLGHSARGQRTQFGHN